MDFISPIIIFILVFTYIFWCIDAIKSTYTKIGMGLISAITIWQTLRPNPGVLPFMVVILCSMYFAVSASIGKQTRLAEKEKLKKNVRKANTIDNAKPSVSQHTYIEEKQQRLTDASERYKQAVDEFFNYYRTFQREQTFQESKVEINSTEIISEEDRYDFIVAADFCFCFRLLYNHTNPFNDKGHALLYAMAKAVCPTARLQKTDIGIFDKSFRNKGEAANLFVDDSSHLQNYEIIQRIDKILPLVQYYLRTSYLLDERTLISVEMIPDNESSKKYYIQSLANIFAILQEIYPTAENRKDDLSKLLSKYNSSISTNFSQSKKQPKSPHKNTSHPDPDITSDLDSLIGMESIKEEIKTLVKFIEIQKKRKEQGLKTIPISYHCVFTGSPGTGKTTVARILAKIYKELGILKKGQLIETDRSGLVGEYVGQTAVKTNDIIDSAIGGVLFIDEAYSLYNQSAEDYGREAIATLIKRMEDDRDNLVVILAGYSNEMKQFIDINPGLQSRFNRYFDFPDYQPSELIEIFKLFANNNEYNLEPEAEQKLQELFQRLYLHRDENFGNARLVRNIFEKTIENQSVRISSMLDPSKEALSEIKAEDLPMFSPSY